ncbi:MerR family transcriptional regulator [Streptomyces sp. NPDC059991]|uniref:MerR family transcriptional regulator n=1 Tax=unclassified Streptomyces TaxID=2593676 RepID=UPI0036D151EF
MTPEPQPHPGDRPAEQLGDRLDRYGRALTEGLDDVLDVEAGLHEVLLQSRHDAAVANLDDILDTEAGLRDALDRESETGTEGEGRALAPVPPAEDTPRSSAAAVPSRTGRELWSYKEIALLLGVRSQTLRSYRKHGLLPPPDVVEGGAPYWFADTIRAWYQRSAAARPRPRDIDD